MTKETRTFRAIVAFFVIYLFLWAPATASEVVTTPESFFGFRLGSDRQIARWDKIVQYFELLSGESKKLRVENMGPSTEGNPFLLVIVSAEENLAKLERLKQVNAQISDSRDLLENRIEELVSEGKAIVCQSMSLHATEIGGTQMAPELTYDLITRRDEEAKQILQNVIFLMVPCFNPDGQIMVTDWYRKNLGTEYEGTGLPWLYHKYVGHDNNRDGFMTTMIESKYMARIMFREWRPQAYLDHHHMGSYGARLYVPPYSEPLRPHADPLIWREHSWYGAHIAYKLEQEAKEGILNAAQYPGWGHFGWHWITPFHNIAGMLTESASAKLATPIYVHPEQLRGGARAFPEYEAQSTFPRPWSGGWWRLRDIIEQQKISAWALLDLAARHKDTVLWNAYHKARRQVERGSTGSPKGYVISRNQHDTLTAVKLVNKLLVQGIEIHQAKEETSIGSLVYPKDSYVISLAQPKMGLIKNLLGQTLYPDNEWTRSKDGSPLRPYDSTTHTMAEYMGVQVDPIDEMPKTDLRKLAGAIQVSGAVRKGSAGYWLDGRLNDSYTAVNLLIQKEIEVIRIDDPGSSERKIGDFCVKSERTIDLQEIAAKTGVDFSPLGMAPAESHVVQQQRIGMYQGYLGGNMDEGWTRFILEQFAFPFKTLRDEAIKKGELKNLYDVIILPHDSTERITGEKDKSKPKRPEPVYPPEYRSGIGKEGVEALLSFVEKGGTLVTLGDATAFAIDKFELDIRNVVEKVDSQKFFCPGSTLRANFDIDHPLAFGMPTTGLILFWNSPAFEIIPSHHNDQYETIVRFPDHQILQSGWLIGEKYLSKKAAMISAKYGEGRVVLIGFRTQNRAQTHGTFKLLFNALMQ
jgi:hypothetical protein